MFENSGMGGTSTEGWDMLRIRANNNKRWEPKVDEADDRLNVLKAGDLDSVLKSSLEKASPHTRKVYGQNPLSGNEVVEMANDRTVITLVSTVRSNGRPHLSPTDVVGVDGKIFVGADLATSHYSNLKRNPVIALMIIDGRNRQALLEGTIEFLDMNSSLALKVQEAEKQKNGWTTEAVAELRPEKAFSWRRNRLDQTGSA
jgi:uncharacterized pyridoxamine 5'-phosphate oxidase family protein